MRMRCKELHLADEPINIDPTLSNHRFPADVVALMDAAERAHRAARGMLLAVRHLSAPNSCCWQRADLKLRTRQNQFATRHVDVQEIMRRRSGERVPCMHDKPAF